MSQYAHLSTVDPDVAAAISHMQPYPPLTADNVVSFRDGMHTKFVPMVQNYCRQFLPSESEYRVEDHAVQVEGGEIKVRVLIPTLVGSDGTTFPVFFWIHAGGWIVGDIDMDDFELRHLCVNLQVVVINVDYRLAPEHPYPIPLNDCYAALKWTTENASKLSISVSKGFIVGGCSAGANMAASLSLSARDDPFFNICQLTGQLLQIPSIIHPNAYPEQYKDQLLSMEQNKDAPFVSRQDIDNIRILYKPTPNDPAYSVLLAPSHENLPQCFIQVCGLDPFRDEGLLYEKVLRESDVKTKLEVYPGLPHGAQNTLPAIPLSVKFHKDFKGGLEWLLSGPKTINV